MRLDEEQQQAIYDLAKSKGWKVLLDHINKITPPDIPLINSADATYQAAFMQGQQVFSKNLVSFVEYHVDKFVNKQD